MMHYLYIDESGHSGNFFDKHGNRVGLTSDYFTIAGIVVRDNERANFDVALERILRENFVDIKLPNEFKLHYNPLLQARKIPYNQLDKKMRIRIADQVFDTINNLNCLLLSVNINLVNHYSNYTNPIPHRVLSLKYIIERFELIVRARSDSGSVVYEKFNERESKKVQASYGKLFQDYGLIDWVEIENVDPKIQFRRAQHAPILQFSDFFAYATWKRVDTVYQKQTRWESISAKYWNLNSPYARLRGNITI